MDVVLQDGALWDASGPPDGFELTFTDIAPSSYAVTLLGAPVGTDTATYSVVVTEGTPLTFPTGTFDGTGLSVTDVNNVLGGGGVISLSLSTRDAGTGDAIAIDGDNTTLDDTAGIPITIVTDGTTALGARTLTVAVNLTLGGTSGPVANSRPIQGAVTLTVWDLDGTVLLASFANGNTDLFSTRIYLVNPSGDPGNVSVRLFTLPIAGGANAQVGTTLVLGVLAAGGGLNIRLAEDVLTPLLIPLPYTTDGGNLFVEVTVEAEGVIGSGQVFQAGNLQSFGIFPLVALP